MEIITVKITGIRPLIMSNPQMIDPDNKFTRRASELQAELKSIKKDNFAAREVKRREIEKNEWMGSIYWSEEGGGIYLPGEMIQACIKEGAKKNKLGKQIDSAFQPIEDAAVEVGKRLPKTLEELYKFPEFSFRKAVKIPPRTGAMVMKVRPMVPRPWTATFVVEFDETVLSKDQVIKSIIDAGTYVGVGNWRPKFGRFTVEVL